MYCKGYVYKGIEIEVFSDGRYITKYTLSDTGKLILEHQLEDITRDLLEPLLNDIYDDIDEMVGDKYDE
jgi:hypothetical protein